MTTVLPPKSSGFLTVGLPSGDCPGGTSGRLLIAWTTVPAVAAWIQEQARKRMGSTPEAEQRTTLVMLPSTTLRPRQRQHGPHAPAHTLRCRRSQAGTST